MAGTQLRELNLRLVGIAGVLQDRLLAVPLYQRSYSWKTEQVEAFWRDLQAALLSGTPDYFMGTIVLSTEAAGPNETRRRVTVIDGQQRLATVSILLACMRDALMEAGDATRARVIENDFLFTSDLRTGSGTPRLELNSEDAEFFATRVIGREAPAPGAQVEFKYPSNQRMLQAREHLRELLAAEITAAGSNWMHRIFDWIEFLQERVRVISITVESEADAFLIFETLNDRGLGLTIADLLKNHLLSLTNGAPDASAVHASWLSMLTAFPSEREDDDDQLITTFIRHLWSSLHGPTRERELYQSLKRRVRGPEQAAEFVSQLAYSAPSYAALLDGDHYRWHELGVDRSLSDSVLRLSLEQPRPLLLAAMDTLDGDTLREVLEAIVSWGTRGLIVGGIGGGTNERYYATAAEAVRRGRARDRLTVAKELEPIIPPDAVFSSAFAERRVVNPRLSRYYVAALELQAQMPNSALLAESDIQRYALVSVLPRRARPENWPGFPRDTINQWALRLGNAVVVESELAIGRVDDFRARASRLAESRLPSAQSIAKSEFWRVDEVNMRQRHMADIAPAIWPRFLAV